jgi:hypothetical protein
MCLIQRLPRRHKQTEDESDVESTDEHCGG